MLTVSLKNLDLYINKTKPDTENASNYNYFGFVDNNNTKCDERAMFRGSLQNLDMYFNP